MSTKKTDPRALALGQRIRDQRAKAAFTQAELGGMVGVTDNAITQYETGRSVPRPKRLEALAAALGVSVTWLLTGDDPSELAKAQTEIELEALKLLREVPMDRQPLILAALRGMAASVAKKVE